MNMTSHRNLVGSCQHRQALEDRMGMVEVDAANEGSRIDCFGRIDDGVGR